MANQELHLQAEGERRQQCGQCEAVWQIKSVTYFLRVRRGNNMVSMKFCSESGASLTR